MSILDWQSACKAMHKLWLHGLWDRFTYGEISLHHSKMNRQGQKICKELEKAMGVPFFLYVYYHYEYHENGENYIVPRGMPSMAPPVCPKCEGEWMDDLEFCICEKCRLMMDSPAWHGHPGQES